VHFCRGINRCFRKSVLIFTLRNANILGERGIVGLSSCEYRLGWRNSFTALQAFRNGPAAETNAERQSRIQSVFNLLKFLLGTAAVGVVKSDIKEQEQKAAEVDATKSKLALAKSDEQKKQLSDKLTKQQQELATLKAVLGNQTEISPPVQ